MPKTRHLNSTLSNNNSTTEKEGTDIIVKPNWNTSPNTLPGHLLPLRRWLPTLDPRYVTLVEFGYVLSKGGSVNCVSDNHIDRLIAKLIPRGTFADPCVIDADDEDFIGLESAEGGVAMTADEQEAWHKCRRRARYQVGTEIIESVDGSMCDDILSTVDDVDTREELKLACSSSGVVLLVIWETKRAAIALAGTGNFGDTVLKRIKLLEDTGLDGPTVEDFNHFKSQYNTEVKTLPDDLMAGYPNTVIARKLTTAVRNLGPLIASKVDMYMKVNTAAGDIEKTKDTLIEILGALENDEIEEANGRAHAAQVDPRRRTRGGNPRGARDGGRGRGRGGPPAGGPGAGGGSDDKPWDTRAWQPTDGACSHCKILEKPEGRHWRKHCPNRAAAIAARKALEEAPSGNGTGALAAGSPFDPDSLSCDEEDEDVDEPSSGDDAAQQLFAPGMATLIDAGAIDNPSALLAAISTARSSTATAAAPAGGRAAMAHGNPATRSSRQRFYVLPYAEHPGIYFGSWQNDGVRELSEHRSKVGPAHTSKAFDVLPHALNYCNDHGVTDVFRGPVVPPDHNLLVGVSALRAVPEQPPSDGDDAPVIASVRPSQPPSPVPSDAAPSVAASSPVYSPTDDERDDSDDGEAGPLPPPLAPPPPAPPAPVAAPPPPPLPPVGAHVAGGDPPAWDWMPAGLRVEMHPLRARFRAHLAEQYRCSLAEGVSSPPMTKNRGARDAWIDGDGREYFRGQRGKAALWIDLQIGDGGVDARAAHGIRAGSQRLRGSFEGCRAALGEMAALAGPMPNHALMAGLAHHLAADFATARDTAIAQPVVPTLLGVPVTTTFRARAIQLAWSSTWVLGNLLLVLAALHFSPSLLRDPGNFLYTAALLTGGPIVIMSLPIVLSVLTLLLLSGLSSQAKRRGAGGVASTAGISHGGPSGQSSSTGATIRARSSAAFLDLLRRRSESSAPPPRPRILLAAALASAPSIAASVTFLLVTAFFYLGATAIGTRSPPSSTLSSSSPPSCRRASDALRRSVVAFGGSVTRVTGGTARHLRRLPMRLAAVTFYLTLVCCLGRLPPANDPRIVDSFSYLARCDFSSPVLSSPIKLPVPEVDKVASEVKATRAAVACPRNARALTLRLGLTKATTRALLSKKSEASRAGALRLIVDSGCTMHCHPFSEDLVNHRASRETMSGIDGIKRRVRLIGDMPVVARDSKGQLRRLLIRNVRCVPEFTETLISVDRLWLDAGSETRFANRRKVYVPAGSGKTHAFPFDRGQDGLYVWSVVGSKRQQPGPTVAKSSRALASTVRRALSAACCEQREVTSDYDTPEIHAAGSTSHLRSLDADTLAAVLHHRLHLSPRVIARLPTLARDVPSKVSTARGCACPSCIEANASRLPHSSNDVYQASYPGRLVHCDIVGPFKPSAVGSYQYALVLVDDHSRYKFVYFLKRKSEALKCVRKFVASLNRHLNRGRSSPVKLVGSLHTDNAGEFLSHEFKDFLDSELISQSTCPPYVHSLNGVAERAIRTIVENARAHMVASNCPLGFWPHAFEHAVDVLNRCTGPTGGQSSSFELLEGTKPKLLPIQPFGCRAFAVKPRHQYSKTNLDPHGTVGINLGRSPSVINAYRIWIPKLSKVVVTSDVYFDAALLPWRAKGDQRVGPVVPESAPADDAPSAVPAAEVMQNNTTAASLEEAYDLASRRVSLSARSSVKVLVLCSGPYERPDGLGAYLRKFGLEPVLVDNDKTSGGAWEHDLLNDEFYLRLVERVRAGEFCAIFAAPPCSTFSISRFYPRPDSPPVVRTREHILGKPDVDPLHRRELAEANAMVARVATLLLTGWGVGTQFALENPVDRGDRADPRAYLQADHGSIWQMPEIAELQRVTGAQTANFCQCMLGAAWQKRTTFLFSSGFDRWFAPLRGLECTHSSHAAAAGGVRDDAGEWVSRSAAAYPAQLNLYIAKALSSLHTSTVASALPKSSGSKVGPSIPISPREHATKVVDARAAAPAPLLPPTAPPQPLPAVAVPTTPAVVPPPAAPLVAPPPTPPPPRPSPRDSSASEVTVEARDLAGQFDVESPEGEPAEARKKSVWGERLAKGSPIKRSLRSHRALFLLSGALMALSPLSGRACEAATAAADPRNRDDALRRDHAGWTKSMDKEYQNHTDNGSWEWISLSDLPRGRHLIKLVWVFKVKRDGKLKSRLCVQGCAQSAGVDYHETFSSALRSTSLRLLACLAARNDLKLHRWDFVSAYLQGALEPGEVVYCHAPAGYEKFDKKGNPMICKVVKPIYGMAQAGRRWQRGLFAWLKEFGFKQSEHDNCVFHCEREMQTPHGPRLEKLLLGVYVDDLATGYKYGDKHSLYHLFTSELQKRWKVEDEGALSDLLGIEFSNSDGVVELKQSAYIRKLADVYLPDGVPTTFQRNKPPCSEELPQQVLEAVLQKADSIDPRLLKKYQSIVGALLYCATNTRPDVAYSVGLLCRAMGKPTDALYAAAQRVLMYLYRTQDLGLRFAASPKELHGYSDSDWGVQHSTTGWVFVLNEAALSWGSKKQPSIALSSCEAEIMAASTAATEAVHLSELAAELGVSSNGNKGSSPDALELLMDNKAAIDVAYNPEHHTKMKHVARRHFYVRELVEEHRIRCTFVSTVDNLADFFTKPLKPAIFFAMRDKIMNVPVSEQRALCANRVLVAYGASQRVARASGHGGVLRGAV